MKSIRPFPDALKGGILMPTLPGARIMDITSVAFAVTQIGATFSLAPFDVLLQPLIDETLAEQGKNSWRRGTRLIPGLLILAGVGLDLAPRPQL